MKRGNIESGQEDLSTLRQSTELTTTTKPTMHENTSDSKEEKKVVSGSIPANAIDTKPYDQLGDIYYIIDRNNIIVNCGPEREWNSFAVENGGVNVEANKVIGKDLFSYISGVRTREQYHKIHNLIWSGKKKRFIIKSMCDSPEFRRPLRTCISSISSLNNPDFAQYLLYHHCIWDEQSRPPVHHLNCPHFGTSSSAGIPILYMCSYCKDVRYPAGSEDGKWVPSAEYYAKCEIDGSRAADDVLLSHTVCDKCFNLVAADLEEEMTK
jgi:hypothetical protein